ncbi:MAG TPA: hypothetical protein VM223_18205, partial [Planctomycetota bacterium]|nr:hypothetical protein [Planctomycetota bacterium]
KKGKPIMEAIFHEHAAHAVAMTRPGGLTSQLLRLNVLGSLGRLTYWQAMPLRHIDVLVPRFSFTGGGTDSIEYGNFRFMPGWAGAWTGDVWGWRGDA